MKAYPTDIRTSKAHLGALIERYGQVANSVRAAIDETGNAGDADTADLLTAYSRVLDKVLWFVEAHVQKRNSAKDSSSVRAGCRRGWLEIPPSFP